MQVIKNDNIYIKPYFKEIFGRTVNYLKGKENLPGIKNFLKILNENLDKKNEDFDQVHNETLIEFL
jgi:hypothetical protein